MPYSIFNELDLKELRPPLLHSISGLFCEVLFGYFRGCSYQVDDFYVPVIFVIFDMVEDAIPKSILWGFFGHCRDKIDAKNLRLTFKVGEHHVEFSLFNTTTKSLFCGNFVSKLKLPQKYYKFEIIVAKQKLPQTCGHIEASLWNYYIKRWPRQWGVWSFSNFKLAGVRKLGTQNY